MKLQINIAITNDEIVFKKSLELSKYNCILEKFEFNNNDIELLEIDILMVYTEGKYESFKDWYKLNEPKYILKSKTLKIETFLKNTLLDNFVKADLKEDYKLLSRLILNTVLEVKLPMKVKNLDKEKLELELNTFFKKEGII